MIKKIILKNFQSHKKSELLLESGINTIIGKSDNGKSAILRAINYLITNRPTSNNYLSHWIDNDNMEITIESNNNKITRFKNKTENGYIINDLKLKAIGQEIPPEIRILNLGDVNIQKQLDTHFLLADTPGEVAKYFNKIVKLDSIDICLQEIDSKKRQTNKDLKQITEKKIELEQELLAYNNLDDAENFLSKLKIYDSKINNLENDIISIENKLNQLNEINTKLYNIPNTQNANIFIVELNNYIIEETEINKNIDNLNYSINNFPTKIPKLDTVTTYSIITKLHNYIIEETEINNTWNKLEFKIKNLKMIMNNESNLNVKLVEYKNQLPDICPLCNQKIKGN